MHYARAGAGAGLGKDGGAVHNLPLLLGLEPELDLAGSAGLEIADLPGQLLAVHRRGRFTAHIAGVGRHGIADDDVGGARLRRQVQFRHELAPQGGLGGHGLAQLDQSPRRVAASGLGRRRRGRRRRSGSRSRGGRDDGHRLKLRLAPHKRRAAGVILAGGHIVFAPILFIPLFLGKLLLGAQLRCRGHHANSQNRCCRKGHKQACPHSQCLSLLLSNLRSNLPAGYSAQRNTPIIYLGLARPAADLISAPTIA